MMNVDQLLLEKLEGLFGDEPFDPVEEELFKWFLYVYSGKGSAIKELDNLNYELFKCRLNLLIDAVYLWHKEQN